MEHFFKIDDAIPYIMGQIFMTVIGWLLTIIIF